MYLCMRERIEFTSKGVDKGSWHASGQTGISIWASVFGTGAPSSANACFLRICVGNPRLRDFTVGPPPTGLRSEEHTSELQSRGHLVCRLLLEKKKKTRKEHDA